LSDQAGASACAADKRTLQVAEEAYNAQNGSYVSEAALATAGRLKGESTMHDITLGVDTYSVVAVGECAGGAPASSAAPLSPTPIDAPPSVTVISGTPDAYVFGSFTPVVMMLGMGTGTANRGYEAAVGAWNTLVGGPPSPAYQAVIIDTAPYGNSVASTDYAGVQGSAASWFLVIFDGGLLTTDTSQSVDAGIDAEAAANGATVCHAANAAQFNSCLVTFGLT